MRTTPTLPRARDIAGNESAVTRALVAGLDEAGWHTPTPAAGWDVADQISHLAYFDEVTVPAIVGYGAETRASHVAGAKWLAPLNPEEGAAMIPASVVKVKNAPDIGWKYIDAMLDPAMNPWDCCALVPILREAGGAFTDWTGAGRIDSGKVMAAQSVLRWNHASGRVIEGDELMQAFRTLRPRGTRKPMRAFSLVEVEGEEEPAAARARPARRCSTTACNPG